jgi:hypothetical protein
MTVNMTTTNGLIKPPGVPATGTAPKRRMPTAPSAQPVKTEAPALPTLPDKFQGDARVIPLRAGARFPLIPQPNDRRDFSFLHESQRIAAKHSYEVTLGLLDRVDIFPRAVLIDIDGTLINYRELAGEPIVPQGRIVGLMQACHDRGIPLGIQSYWWEDDIRWLLEQHPRIADMVRGEDEKPFIRGRESICRRAESLAMPDRDLFFMWHQSTIKLKDGTRQPIPGSWFGYYDFMEDPVEPTIRCPKIPLPGEVLLDDHRVGDIYHKAYETFAPLFPDWEETALACAMRRARPGLVQIDPMKKPYSGSILSEAERARFFVALNSVHMQESGAVRSMTTESSATI